MHKNKLCSADLCRVLDCSLPTLLSYINNPCLIRLKDIILLAGCFGLSTESLVYCLTRGFVQPKKNDSSLLSSYVGIGEREVKEFKTWMGEIKKD